MRREERAGVAAWTGEEERRKEDGKKTGGRYNMITGTTRIPGEREGGQQGQQGQQGQEGQEATNYMLHVQCRTGHVNGACKGQVHGVCIDYMACTGGMYRGHVQGAYSISPARIMDIAVCLYETAFHKVHPTRAVVPFPLLVVQETVSKHIPK